jgi:hypothetical protein
MSLQEVARGSLLGGCSFPRLLARSIARLHPFPRYPPCLPSPPTLSIHVLPSAAFPAIPHAPRCCSMPLLQLTSSLFLPSSLARSIAGSPPFPHYPSSLPRPRTPRSLACSLDPPPSLPQLTLLTLPPVPLSLTLPPTTSPFRGVAACCMRRSGGMLVKPQAEMAYIPLTEIKTCNNHQHV